jgi:beta-glucosidase
MSVRPFPAGFVWGAATSGHQTEGGNSGSDTWFAELVQPTVFKEPSGMACNSYELWREDVDLVAGMGLNAYRFSVEWARIEPSDGTFDDAELAHYGAVIARCRELGLAPVVTLNHFTCPHWFAMRGGWLAPDAARLFARYCGRVIDAIGQDIAYAVTMNEPNLARLLTWIQLPDVVRYLERATLEAAGKAAGVTTYRLANVMLPEEMDAMAAGMTAGHLAARAAIKARRPDLPVGLSIAIIDDQVVGDDTAVRDRKRAEVYARWLELARDDDFVGVQNYERARYDAAGAVPPPEGAVVNHMGSDIYPPSLAHAVRYAHDATGVPVLITEHGLAHDDDTHRGPFIEAALAELHGVIADGVPVLGYIHWTLLDNFEWIFGYDFHYGLHAVDRESFVRTAKPSVATYSRIARANSVPALA